MQQQINLFNALPKLPKYYLSENLLIQILSGFLIFLVAITLFQFVWLQIEKYDVSSLQKSTIASQTELSKITQLTGQVDIANVQREIAHKQQLLQTLQSRKITSGQCSLLSNYFTSLAEMAVPGLWFSQIGVDLNKDEVVLAGLTYAPVLMVQLVSNLNDTDCFSDREFGPVKITSEESKDKNNLLRFVISSRNASTLGNPT